MKSILAALALATLLLSTGPIAAQALPQAPVRDAPVPEVSAAQQRVAAMSDVVAVVRAAGEYEAQRQWRDAAAAWLRAAQLRRHNPQFLYSAAANLAQAGELSGTYDTLLRLQRAGLGYDLERDARFKNAHGTELWDFLVDLNTTARTEAFGEGELAFELPPADLLLESIAWDPASETFVLGSARTGVIYRRQANGELVELARPQGDSWWSIFDLKLDPAGRHLWATTAAVPHFKDFKPALTGRSALLKINLADGALVAAYPAPDDGLPHILNGIAVSPQGLVVVAEGMRGQLFKLEGDSLRPLMAERRLNALRGMAFSADGSVLYFADYEMGLFGLQMNTRVAFDVTGAENVLLSGIEGLYQYEGQLVAIQNGVTPQRVMRYELDDSGRAVAMAVPLEAANPAFATPTLGTLVGSQLHYIANSQRDYYDAFGLRKSSRPLPPVKVMRTDARFNWDFTPPRLPGGRAPIKLPPADLSKPPTLPTQRQREDDAGS
jgi:sugar lactone lactonase YvrE